MEEEYTPLIVAVDHTQENLPDCTAVIHRVIGMGKKSVGFEADMRVKKTHIQQLHARGFPALKTFFNQLENTAREYRLETIPLYPGAIDRILEEHLTNPELERFFAETKEVRPVKKRDIARFVRQYEKKAGQYPYYYIQQHLTNKAMEQRAREQKPEVIVVGMEHALHLASKLGVPYKDLVLVENQKQYWPPQPFWQVARLKYRHFKYNQFWGGIDRIKRTAHKGQRAKQRHSQLPAKKRL
jgi:hypothetical protein